MVLEPDTLRTDHDLHRAMRVGVALRRRDLEVPEANPRAAVAVRALRGAGHEVGDAEEVRDVGGRGVLVDLMRGSDLDDPPCRHHRDAVGHRQGLLLVVRHVDERDADLLLEGLQLDLQRLAELRVEGAERLVEQEHRGVEDQRSRERDTLLLSPGELRRPPLLVSLEPDERERVEDLLADVLLRHVLVPQPEGDVVVDVQVGKQRVVLEHRVDVALVRRRLRHVDAVEQDLTVGRPLEARDQAERGGLSAAGRAQQREELPSGHVQVDAVDGRHIGEPFDEIDELDFATCHPQGRIHGRPRAC